jgi:hypothetical protein
LSGTNDRAPFRPGLTGNFPVAANETAADMLCCALYLRIQTFPSTDLHLHGGGLETGVDALTIRKNVWVGRKILFEVAAFAKIGMKQIERRATKRMAASRM